MDQSLSGAKVVQLIPPQTATSTVTGSGTELVTDSQSGVLFVASAGAVSGTTPTNSVAIETSPDGTSYTTVATLTTLSTSDAVAQALVDPALLGPYTRAVAALAGTTPSFAFEVVAIYKPQYAT